MNRVPEMNQGVEAVDASVHAGVDERGQLDQQPSQETVKRPTPTSYSRWGLNTSGQPPATQYWPAHSGIPASTPAQSADKDAPTLKGRLSHTAKQPPPSRAPYDAGNSPTTFSSPSFRAGGQSSTSSTQQQGDDNGLLTLNPSFRAGEQPTSSTMLSESPGNPTHNSLGESNSGDPTRQRSLFNGFDSNHTQRGPGSSQRLNSESSSASPRRVIDGVLPPYSQYNSELNGSSDSMSHVFPQVTSPLKRDLAEAKKKKNRPQKNLGDYHAGTVPGVPRARDK